MSWGTFWTPGDASRRAFCDEFRGLCSGGDGTEGLCLGRGRGGRRPELPQCLAEHLELFEDAAVGCLFAVYWGCLSGDLTEAEASSCGAVLSRERERVRAAVSRRDPGLSFLCGTSALECRLPPLGLEVYAGCFSPDPLLRMDGSGRTCTASEALDSGQDDLSRGRIPCRSCISLEHRLCRGLPLSGYSSVRVLLGEYVTPQADRLPLFAWACRSDAGHVWLEVADRADRWLRYPAAPVSKGGTCSLLAHLVVDAGGEAYEVSPDGQERHVFRDTDMLPRRIAKTIVRCEEWASGLSGRDAVVAQLPPPSASASRAAGRCIVRSCCRALCGLALSPP